VRRVAPNRASSALHPAPVGFDRPTRSTFSARIADKVEHVASARGDVESAAERVPSAGGDVESAAERVPSAAERRPA